MADMTHEPKRGGRRLHHALTAKGVQTVSAPGRYFDGHGLYLLVEPTGAKRWKQRLAVHGKAWRCTASGASSWSDGRAS